VENNLKEERFLFGSQFQSIVAWLIVSGPGKAEHHGRLLVEEQSSSIHGSQEAEKERDHGQNTSLKCTPPVTSK
jgi:hypothetical protein